MKTRTKTRFFSIPLQKAPEVIALSVICTF